MSDVTAGISKEASILMDIKIGFQTYRADQPGVLEPKRVYFDKAQSQNGGKFLSEEELRTGKVSKARYMSINQSISSTCTNGFRLDGMRVGEEVLTIEVDNRTISDFEAFAWKCTRNPAWGKAVQTGVKVGEDGVVQQESMWDQAATSILELVKHLEASSLFMQHHLYGSSVLILLDLERGTARCNVIDIARLVDRGAALTDHRLEPAVLPLSAASTSDGYLTGLENLARFFRALDAATAGEGGVDDSGDPVCAYTGAYDRYSLAIAGDGA